MNTVRETKHRRVAWAVPALLLMAVSASAAINIAQEPLYLGGSAAPLNLLVLGRDHTLYYEAYNDASDLNDDGVIDVGYDPEHINYFGYFDSFKCYGYDATGGRFVPTARAPAKTCDNAWSGDFLNYLTTARIDALRKVLYGGKRLIDSENEVVLERSYVPQDAHSWGKEYRGLLYDGYDIRDYAPLPLPAAGTRHLFANTTLLKSGDKEPRLRVLTHSTYRIWEWVAIERPVAGSRCEDGAIGPLCTGQASSDCEITPDLDLTQRTYRITVLNRHTGYQYPANETQFDELVRRNAIHDNFCGERKVDEVNGEGNPFSYVYRCSNDRYLSLFEGTITIADAGSYTFAVDGDDAVEVAIDGHVIAAWYGGHAQCSTDTCRCEDHDGTVYLTPGEHQIRFRHQDYAGGDQYYLRWRRYRPASEMTDYFVRVRVCDPSVVLEANCRVYPDGQYRPAGLLQKYGEDDQMLFGLLSGTYTHPYNMQGGVLRKNMGSIQDEIDLNTGQFTDTTGIIGTIDRMRIIDFDRDRNYEYRGGWLTTSPMSASSSRFPDWGNPIGEMLYEGVRYFAGKESPTYGFRPTADEGMESIELQDFSGSSSMRLPLPEWTDPFDVRDVSTAWCSAGAMLVISDVNPSYDSDSVPGSRFSGFDGDLDGLDAAAQADAIWTLEHGQGSSQHFIGQSGENYDGAPSEKTVDGLGSIRGLAPAEPTKEGAYYSAGVAKYAFETDLRPELNGVQSLNTVVVALASPLPRIEIPVDGSMVSIVPFAKSVGGYSISTSRGAFQPTNTIVDFFIDTFANTDPLGSDADADVNGGRPYVKFRINFEDVEQGADHDMDAIIVYEAVVNSDQTLTVNLTSEYAAGSIMHHLGYVISGTTADGVYLEVRDQDTGASEDPDYFLDTPGGLRPGACEYQLPAACDDPLPLAATRTFTASTQHSGATLLESPLWYAAKYGAKGNDELEEGETAGNYFLVTNATDLEKQLDSAFFEILGLISSASAAATNSTLLRDDTLVYQARFDPGDWSGEVRAVEVSSDGSQGGVRWSTHLPGRIPVADARRIFTFNGEDGVEFIGDNWDRLSLMQCAGLLDAEVSELETALADAGVLPDAGGEYDCAMATTAVDTSMGLARIDWLRGDQSREEPFGPFRARSELLGDVINSNPFLVDLKDYDFQRLAAVEPETSYDEFRAGLEADGRRSVLYIGSNDGMLHGLDGNTGHEVLAYVPQRSFEHIAELTDPEYQHRYFVDGSPRALDAWLEQDDGSFAWRTVLIGSTGAGGRAVFALDVTDPDDFGEANVLWELTDPELGVSIGQPTIARLAADDRWVAIFGNGYNSQSARAQLFIVDLDDGTVVKRIDTNVGDGARPNGLASPTPVDVDDDRITDYVYAGDLLGNMWKFDLTGDSEDDWGLAYPNVPLFKATDALGVAQPITHRPAVARHPFGGQMVLFGTGKFFSEDDNAVPDDVQVQSFYGIRDFGAALIGARDDLLQQQRILYQGPSGNRDIKEDVRLLSDEEVNWNERSGWYLDLKYLDAEEGERVIDPPVLRTDRVVFTTLIPNDDECSTGGVSWLMELEYLDGGRLPYSVFDLDDDERFDASDYIRVTLPSQTEEGETETLLVSASAIFIPAIAKVPAFLNMGYKDVKYSSLSSGGLLDVDNRADSATGRQSWRQLR